MKNRYFIALLMMMLFCGNVPAQNLRELFVNMPTELLPLLRENDRLDLIDLYDAKMNIQVTNRLDGKSTIKELTGDYLLLSLSPSSSMQMKMLPSHNGDTLLCVVNTVRTTLRKMLSSSLTVTSSSMRTLRSTTS